ncbi:hypothetical protein Pmani_000559 [Petrolisthes manimaculis]|uniref:Uncharacterized protein n=1 Tax=Petrolisthes manimaculis TaxID=1843537 RepID=A0AAE1QM96_9EUCA|nr:hypothetical protein Pmani_000559 [Petrolisthes manimaculis]
MFVRETAVQLPSYLRKTVYHVNRPLGVNTEYLFHIPPKPGRVITIAASGLQLLSLTHLNTEYLFYIPPKHGRVISIAASGLYLLSLTHLNTEYLFYISQ